MSLLHVYFLLVCAVLGMYEGDSPVFKLTQENFKREVMDSTDLWFVEFYAPWCGHCKKLAPEYEKAARKLSGIVRLGAVDMTVDPSVGAPYDVKGYPTVKFFGEDKTKPLDYSGDRTSKAITSFGKKQAKIVANKRGQAESGTEEPAAKVEEPVAKVEEPVPTEEQVKTEEIRKTEAKEEPVPVPPPTPETQTSQEETAETKDDEDTEKETNEEEEPYVDERDVLFLHPDNFTELVLDSPDMWFVDFMAPWCDHCKLMRPDWAKLARSLRGVMKFGKFEANMHRALADEQGVQGYPTLKVYPPNDKSQGYIYEGSRDFDSLYQYINKEMNKHGVPPKIWQFGNYESFNETCGENEARVCVIVFLPHIYDTTAADREKHLATIVKVATMHRLEPFAWLWAQAGDHYKLEQQFGIGFGYPSVLLINRYKSKAAIMKSAFNEHDFDRFLTKMMRGRVALSQYEALAGFGNMPLWDGKDANPEMQEEVEAGEKEQKQRAEL